jgi:hypothetical protein
LLVEIREWYFIRRLRPEERPDSNQRLEVQVLNDDGMAVIVGYFDDSTGELAVGTVTIPWLVLDAAKRKADGQGDYVGPDGVTMRPF